MSEFKLPQITFIPEIDEVPITLAKFKSIIDWSNEYNLASRMGQNDQAGDPVPARYVGKNRYWITEGEGQDAKVGPYAVFSVYDLDPRAADGKVLLVRYRLTDSRNNLVQTQVQASRHIQAARLEAERKERMAKKDPKLNQMVDIHMPDIYTPVKAQAKALEALNANE
jgi:hypothetical protein